MRRLLTIATFIPLLLLVNAKVLVVHKADGTTEEVYLSDVRRITFDSTGYSPAGAGPLSTTLPISTGIGRVRDGVIRLRIADPAHARLDLYTLRGRHTRSLVDEKLGKGTHTYSIPQAANPAGNIFIVKGSIGDYNIARTILTVR
jgi:hypothetical protein